VFRPFQHSCATGLLAAVSLAISYPSSARVIEVEQISVTVADLTRTEAFYRDGLGFQTLSRDTAASEGMQRLYGVPAAAKSLTMELGRQRVEFVEFEQPGRLYPTDSCSADLWFQHFAIVVRDMDASFARLSAVHFQSISVNGPQTLPAADGHVRAFKFRDPDGHPLELIYFPPGVGRAVWESSSPAQVALGIDHTAIAVSNTRASEAFYATLLGMHLAYEQVNRGPAQERLDATFDAMVRITGLRPDSPDGPGIELLDYRAPSTGRPMPRDSRAIDLWHEHTVVRVDRLEELVARLGRAEVRFVSPGIVRLANGRRAAEVIDPDGHTIVIEQ
jgi:catechol 2,3-dioxygenase-like lactoylglutathione lyase family enzyme